MAGGQPNDKSDIDILVDMEPGRSLLDLGGIWHDLNALLGGKVNGAAEKGLRLHIRDEVIETAVPL